MDRARSGKPGARRLPRWKRALFVVATVIAVLAVLEITLRVAAMASDRVAELLSLESLIPVPDPVLGHRPNPAISDHDPEGWRNRERPERAAIVAIGDSQTYGAGVARKNAWPQRLESYSGTTTYNMALGGYGGAQYWRLTEEALALQPELIIVGLYAGNDLTETYRALYLDGLAPELRSEDPAVLAALEAAERNRTDPGTEHRDARRGAWYLTYRRWIGDPFQKLKLYALVRVTRYVIGEKEDRSNTDWNRYVRRVEGVDPNVLFPFREGEVATVFTPTRRLACVDLTDPRNADGFRALLEGIRRMRDRVKGEAAVLVLLIPTKELVYAPRVRQSGITPPEAYARLVEAEPAMWDRVRGELDAGGIPWIDALEPLRKALARGENPYQMDWDGHPNVLGYDAIARTVAESEAVRDLAAGP